MNNFDEKDLLAYQHYIETGQPINEPGLRIIPADTDGECWRVLAIFNLEDDNHILLSILDKNGQYLGYTPAAFGWTWDGRKPEEVAGPIELKASPERGNIGFVSSPISVWGILNGLKSDEVVGITSPVYIVFGRVAGSESPELPPVEPGDCGAIVANALAVIEEQITKIDAVIAQAGKLVAVRGKLVEVRELLEDS